MPLGWAVLKYHHPSCPDTARQGRCWESGPHFLSKVANFLGPGGLFGNVCKNKKQPKPEQ